MLSLLCHGQVIQTEKKQKKEEDWSLEIYASNCSSPQLGFTWFWNHRSTRPLQQCFSWSELVLLRCPFDSISSVIREDAFCSQSWCHCQSLSCRMCVTIRGGRSSTTRLERLVCWVLCACKDFAWGGMLSQCPGGLVCAWRQVFGASGVAIVGELEGGIGSCPMLELGPSLVV